MSDEKKIISYDSDEAATRQTMTVWVARTGQIWPDSPDGEHMARYCGSTHNRCDCGKMVEKSYTMCEECRAKREEARFSALPREPWNGDCCIYSERFDRYLGSVEEAIELMQEHGCTFDFLNPLLCSPITVHLDTDNFCDELTDDGDAPVELEDAIDAFNKAMDGVVLSWTPMDVIATWKGPSEEA